MLTATKDLMLPATVTGSWPRPRWYDGGLWGRPLDTALLDVRFREQFLDAHATVDRRPGARRARHPDQRRLPPRRGLRRPLVAPLPAAALEGPRARGAAVRGLARPPARVPGRDADERDRDDVALAARRRQGRARPEEPARVRRSSGGSPRQRAASGKPVKFGTCSSQVLAIFLDSHTAEYDLDDKKQLIWDMAERDEPRAAPARRGRREGHPDRGADDPLHGRASTRRRPSCSTSWSTRSTTRSRASTTSSCGSTPAGATPTCRRSTAASRTRTRSRSTSTA